MGASGPVIMLAHDTVSIASVLGYFRALGGRPGLPLMVILFGGDGDRAQVSRSFWEQVSRLWYLR